MGGQFQKDEKVRCEMKDMPGKNVRIAIALVFGAVLAVAASAAIYAGTQPPAEGSVAPDFALSSQEAKTVDLHDFRGKWVVLYFYPKDMTTGCTIEAHNFQRDLAKYQADNAVVLGVSVDTVNSHKQFCTKDSLTFTLLSDSDKKVVSEYGSLGSYGPLQIANRNTFLINPQGKIVKVWTKVNPDVHSEEVLAALGGFEKQ
jgi:thioredoxin-dependent peroxiredoxin